MDMSEEKSSLPSETFFLPPLKMVLTFFDRESRERPLPRNAAGKQKESDEKTVERLIEKLSEKDE
jgi:hypothetical protein